MLFAAFCQGQNLVQGEYFFDSDPGPGLGSSLTITADPNVDQTFNIDISSLSDGFHNMFIRFKDENGNWSLYDGRVFYILSDQVASSDPNLVAYEYFFDTDPGVGFAENAFTPGLNFDNVLNIDISGLSEGFHNMFIRFKDENGNWSLYDGRVFYILSDQVAAADPNLVAYEYFFDTDPGVGFAENAITPGLNFDNVLNIDISGLPEGFHNLFIRFKDENGNWSLYDGRVFYILSDQVAATDPNLVAYEYFFDTDPGVGFTENALTPGLNFDNVLNIDISSLSDGFHNMFIRFKDENGNWSLYEGRVFYILPLSADNPAMNVVHMEYFIDVDQSPGTGDTITISGPAMLIDEEVIIDLTSHDLADGDYTLSIRAMDDLGQWSIVETQVFTVCTTASVYYADADSDGFGDINSPTYSCSFPINHVDNSDDCDDTNPAVNTDPVTWYIDNDNDGYGDPGTTISVCKGPAGYALNGLDCDDNDITINPDTEWYEDADNDGFGNSSVSQISCTQPTGYVSLSTDCDDFDPEVNPDLEWYFDADIDGFGDPLNSTMSCTQPAGYVEDGTDCNDNNATIPGAETWYLDTDLDGFGDPITALLACSQPAGYVDNGLDCDDQDNTVLASPLWYLDSDSDGFGDPNNTLNACSQPVGYVANDLDCNDNDPGIGEPLVWFEDADSDGFGNLANTTASCTQPTGYVNNSMDCDDSNNSLGEPPTWFEDLDQDGFGNPGVTVIDCIQPVGYVDNNLDCDDQDNTVLASPVWYLDSDNDGFGDLNNSQNACSQPAGYVSNSDDCDDSSIQINPLTIWYLDNDNDGYGNIAIALVSCSQPSGYILSSTDCDDGNLDVYPGAPAKPDGKDNDCDGVIDKVSQSITFDLIDDKMDNNSTFVLSASSTSALQVLFEVAFGDISINGNDVTLMGVGEAGIRAYQDGDDRYLSADSVLQTFCVNPVPKIERDKNSLTVNYPDAEYQWFIDGTEIPGGTNTLQQIIAAGDYSVQVKIGLCKGISVPQFYRPVDPLNIGVPSFNSVLVDDNTVKISLSVSDGLLPYMILFEHKPFLSTVFTKINMQMDVPGDFEFQVLSTMLDNIGMVFKISISDQNGDTGFINESFIYRAFSDAKSKTISYNSQGDNIENYRIISIPYKLENDLVADIFGNLGEIGTVWRLVRWENGKFRNYLLSDRIKLGNGYWFISTKQAEIPTGAGEVSAVPFTMSLTKDWNEIGNPYPVPVSWESIRKDQQDIVSEIYIFNPSSKSYFKSDILKPFEGGFVFAESSTNLDISPLLHSPSSSVQENEYALTNQSIDEGTWGLNFSLFTGAETIDLGGIGMHPDADLLKDPYDRMTVPRFLKFTELYVTHSDYSYPWFSVDIVPTTDNYAWDLTLASNQYDGLTTLVWDNYAIINDHAQLWLLDATKSTILNMKEIGAYDIDLSEENKILIQYSRDDQFVPEFLVLGNAYPNPAGNLVVFPVALPDRDADYNLELEIRDMNGKLVKTLIKGRYNPGIYEWTWNRENETGKKVASGIYFYRLIYNDNQSQQKRIFLK